MGRPDTVSYRKQSTIQSLYHYLYRRAVTSVSLATSGNVGSYKICIKPYELKSWKRRHGGHPVYGYDGETCSVREPLPKLRLRDSIVKRIFGLLREREEHEQEWKEIFGVSGKIATRK